MSVEVALSVMAAARTGRLVVCDQDDQCTGLVTRMELTAVRDSSAYTDRVRLRDILGDHRSFTSPVTTMAEAEHAMRSRRLGALPVVDGQRQPPGRPRPLRLNRLTLVGPFSPSPCEATWAASSRFPFELTENGVLESMKGIKPEPGTGESVITAAATTPSSKSARSSPARTAVTSAPPKSSGP